jgi:hypothetical protein
MRLGLRRSVTVLAIYAVALHAILLGLAPISTLGSTATDPFSVICHSEAAAPVEQSPAAPVPAHTCDHCNICSAAPTPVAPDSILLGQLAPARLLHVLAPAPNSAHSHLATSPNLARGPPHFA